MKRVDGEGATAFVMLLCCLLPVVPWVVRNSLILGNVAGISNMAGYNMWYGLTDYSDERMPSDHPDWTAGLAEDDLLRLDPDTATTAAEADRRLVTRVWRYALYRPWHVMARLARNLVLFWTSVSRTVLANGFHGRYLEIFSFPYFAATVLLAAAGLYVNRGRPECQLVMAAVGAVWLAHSPFYSELRHRIQIEMFLTPFAAAMLWDLVTSLRKRRQLETE